MADLRIIRPDGTKGYRTVAQNDTHTIERRVTKDDEVVWIKIVNATGIPVMVFFTRREALASME